MTYAEAVAELRQLALRVAPALVLSPREIVSVVLSADDAARDRREQAERDRAAGNLPEGTKVIVVRCGCGDEWSNLDGGVIQNPKHNGRRALVLVDAHTVVRDPHFQMSIGGYVGPGYLLRLNGTSYQCHAHAVMEVEHWPRK